MPQPIDFTGFYRCLYINFLPLNGIIEVPPTFYNAFYQHLGRKRDYALTGFLSALILQIDSSLARMLTFDTAGIELYVTENNSKILNALIRKLKTYYKDNPDVDPYKMAYGLMPSQAASHPDAKHMYINGHFCKQF